MRLSVLLLALLPGLPLAAQEVRVSERAAKEAVHRIVERSGLLPDFVVRANPEVRTAVAFIKGRERVIEYNPAFIATIVDSSRTNWSAVSILAHEIAHHLLGHTLDPAAVHPGDELACDRYSGFILHELGATLAESLAAMDVAGDPHGTWRHPPKHARCIAIQQGWEDARRLRDRSAPEPPALDDTFQFVVRFAGDRNTYYVDADGRLVWFDEHAEPIGFGACTPSIAAGFAYELTWEDQTFYVDRHNTIWSRTAHGMQMNVGRLEAYARP